MGDPAAWDEGCGGIAGETGLGLSVSLTSQPDQSQPCSGSPSSHCSEPMLDWVAGYKRTMDLSF